MSDKRVEAHMPLFAEFNIYPCFYCEEVRNKSSPSTHKGNFLTLIFCSTGKLQYMLCSLHVDAVYFDLKRHNTINRLSQ